MIFMPYVCGKCGKIIDSLPEGVIRCPDCAYKITYKARESVAKDIKAR